VIASHPRGPVGGVQCRMAGQARQAMAREGLTGRAIPFHGWAVATVLGTVRGRRDEGRPDLSTPGLWPGSNKGLIEKKVAGLLSFGCAALGRYRRGSVDVGRLLELPELTPASSHSISLRCSIGLPCLWPSGQRWFVGAPSSFRLAHRPSV